MEASAYEADRAAVLAVDVALGELEATVGDAEFVVELIGDFLDGLPGQLAALGAARDGGDREVLHRVSHTLKSNALTFGAMALADASRDLEHATRDGQPAAAWAGLVLRVESEAAAAARLLAVARDTRRP